MPTMSDIAKECGISRSVVSLVLNGRDKQLGIAANTREQILRVAREIGYCRNEMAVAIGKKHSRVLAFVTAEMGNVEYTGKIQNGVLDTASERNYTVTVHRLNSTSTAEIIRKILGWRVAGVIFHTAELQIISEIIEVLKKNNIPWGTVNLSNTDGIGVTTDDRAGIENAVQQLSIQGHRRIIFLANGKDAAAEYQRSRQNGYLDGMKKYLPDQAPVILRLKKRGQLEDINFLAENIFPELRDTADAVICESDQLAAAIASAAQKRGAVIPETFSLIGFGNSVISETFNPPLSTIAQDFEKMGSLTVNWLVDVIENKTTDIKYKHFIPTKFINRESVLGKQP